ncbi:hypothetical protein BKA57DRAFT_476606 [Linnemannia elongata]|nr:hypothetical protein BKA57DRAFT_476606 [Linnemannia elongata]
MGGGRSRAYLTCWLDWLAGWLTENGSLCYASRRSDRWFLPAIMAILDPVKNKASPSLLQSCLAKSRNKKRTFPFLLAS